MREGAQHVHTSIVAQHTPVITAPLFTAPLVSTEGSAKHSTANHYSGVIACSGDLVLLHTACCAFGANMNLFHCSFAEKKLVAHCLSCALTCLA